MHQMHFSLPGAASDLAFFTFAWRIKAFNTQPVGSLG
jgi:hypothetical protein